MSRDAKAYPQDNVIFFIINLFMLLINPREVSFKISNKQTSTLRVCFFFTVIQMIFLHFSGNLWSLGA